MTARSPRMIFFGGSAADCSCMTFCFASFSKYCQPRSRLSTKVAIMTATFVLSRDLGWQYFEKLARQKVMQLQSAADPPKKIILGERAVMADGNDYNIVLAKDQGKPVEVVYASEGSPLIIVPAGIFKNAPSPNAARLFQSFFLSAETQQMLVDTYAHRSFHAQVKEKGAHIPLAQLKLLKSDPAAVLEQSEAIKARYTKLFGV